MKQEHVNKAQNALERAIKAMALLERESCECAADDPEYAEGNAKFAEALGLLQQAKGVATMGCIATPGVEADFGGK